MSGTSGSSSDAALATRYAAEYFCKTWTAPGLNQAEGYKAISDLSHHYFRAEGSSPPQSFLCHPVSLNMKTLTLSLIFISIILII